MTLIAITEATGGFKLSNKKGDFDSGIEVLHKSVSYICDEKIDLNFPFDKGYKPKLCRWSPLNVIKFRLHGLRGTCKIIPDYHDYVFEITKKQTWPLIFIFQYYVSCKHGIGREELWASIQLFQFRFSPRLNSPGISLQYFQIRNKIITLAYK